MTDEERQNITARFRLVIDRATTKERRENVNHPWPFEYLECWVEALHAAKEAILRPRRAGRPKKVVAEVITPENNYPQQLEEGV